MIEWELSGIGIVIKISPPQESEVDLQISHGGSDNNNDDHDDDFDFYS